MRGRVAWPVSVEALMDLRTTSRARWEAAGLDGGAWDVLDRVGVREGQPFVLGADGSYDVELNRFFRELPSWGVRAENSVEGYTRDVMLFCRFPHESRGGKSTCGRTSGCGCWRRRRSGTGTGWCGRRTG